MLPEPFDQLQLARRILQPLGTEPQSSAYFASAEDLVLAKLEWFQLGGDASTRQWQDILNILKVQGFSLDMGCLYQWAAELGIADILERAISESGIKT